MAAAAVVAVEGVAEHEGAAERICAIGLARFLPAMSGAQPAGGFVEAEAAGVAWAAEARRWVTCRGSRRGRRASSLRMSPNMFFAEEDVELGGFEGLSCMAALSDEHAVEAARRRYSRCGDGR